MSPARAESILKAELRIPVASHFEALPIARSPVAVIDDFSSPTLSFAVSLGSRGVPLHCYGHGAARWSRYKSRQSACPPLADANRFIPWLRRKIQAGEIQRVAPTTDLLALYVSMLREDFTPQVRRTIPPLAELERALIKTRFGGACMAVGQAIPITEAPDDAAAGVATAERLGFPLVMKPKSHVVVGDERGRLLNDMHELGEFYRPYGIAPGQESLAERYPELRWPLLQKYVPSARNAVFSISGFKDPDTGIVAASLSCKRQQWPPDTGISTTQVSAHDERIMARGLKTVDALVSCGIFELELLEAGTELLAIDLNPRAFGFITLDMALGNDLPWLWFQSTFRAVDGCGNEAGALPSGPPHGRPNTAPNAPSNGPPNASLNAPHPVVECRLPIPYTVGRCVNALFGLEAPVGMQAGATAAKAAASTVSVAKPIPMLGHWIDPLPLLLANLRQLRHPGGLVRPYIRAAAAQRRRNKALAITGR